MVTGAPLVASVLGKPEKLAPLFTGPIRSQENGNRKNSTRNENRGVSDPRQSANAERQAAENSGESGQRAAQQRELDGRFYRVIYHGRVLSTMQTCLQVSSPLICDP